MLKFDRILEVLDTVGFFYDNDIDLLSTTTTVLQKILFIYLNVSEASIKVHLWKY